MNVNLKIFKTNNERTEYENGSKYVEDYVSYVYEDDSVHYNKKE